MKKYILLIFACIYAIHLNAQNAGINFLHGTTWAEAVAKAKAENKLIFIDFYTQMPRMQESISCTALLGQKP